MKLIHRFIILSSIGFGVGIIMGVMITAWSATATYADGNLYLCSKDLIEAVGNPLLAFVIEAFASGLYGILAMGGSGVYAIESWSIAKCTAIHYAVTMAGFYILAFSMRWLLPGRIADALFMFVIITVPYIFIWLINYLSYRAQLRSINKTLEELKLKDREVMS